MKRPPGDEALERQRRLRREATAPELLLWKHLRERRLAGLKFRQQVWLGGYIVDFFCAEAKLIVELDGATHTEDGAKAYDDRRTAVIAGEGYRVCRFWNNDVMQNIEGVLQEIEAIAGAAAPSPSHRFAAGPSLSPTGRGF